jgi:3-deoxy-D-manno-octulosonate 8-phosphate phosphatase (KDO 8-P phosphatase)
MFLNQLKKIKLLVLDVDGVLTDGKLYYTSEGEIQKVFDVKDGLGIKIAIKFLKVCLMSGNSSLIIKRRAKDIGVNLCFIGISDKAKCLKELVMELNLHKEEIAYIGDDLNDLVVIDLVGLFVCPSDAHKSIRDRADLVLSCKGGNGAVREFVDLLLEARQSVSEYTLGIKVINT